MADAVEHTEAWQAKPWKQFQRIVFRLQKRIYRATQRGDTRTVHKLQRLLLSSRAARYLAVRRVTQENRGKRTAGVDGIASLQPPERRTLAEDLQPWTDKATPLRQISIPKPGTTERRKLAIPTMGDRARQALVKLALEPEWEAQFEANSYGFRPGRSTHDAITAIFLSIKHLPKYVCAADIDHCFDRIGHPYLLDKLATFPRLRRLVKSWLQAGILDNGGFLPSTAGTPQGSPVSPLLANIALHGLEDALHHSLPSHQHGVTWRPTVIRYADDIVILHRDRETLEALRVQADTWLAQVGVRLKPSKTRLTHTLLPHNGLGGFGFLGFEVRQYPVGSHRSGTNGTGQRLGFKTLIKPSKTAQTRHLRKTGEVIRQHRGSSQEQLINTLGPIIIGWSRYYSHVVSKAFFTKMYTRVHHQLRRWTAWRHPHKGYNWRMKRYWRRHEGTWGFGKTRVLPRHPQMPIQRHVKVAGTRSPYDGDWAYWGRRLRTYAGLATRIEKLLKKQDGRCMYCGLYFTGEDRPEIHHVDGDRTNSRLPNLLLLHLPCHDALHGTHDQGRRLDKPYDAKGSGTVLQRQGAG